MTATLAARRLAVVLGVTAALLLGGLTVRAAAEWTAASAPLAQPPTSISSLENALKQEQARSAALEQQIRDLGSATSGLNAALDTANAQVAVDQATADQLRAALAAAQAKLATLQASLGARTTTTTTTRTSGGTSTTPPPATCYDDCGGVDN